MKSAYRPTIPLLLFIVSAIFTFGIEAGQSTHWSLSPLSRPPTPLSNYSSPIDNFIQGRLQESKLTFSPPAPKRVLIRRAYIDLIGIPPSPEAVARFLKDTSTSAFERVVDELLSSPHYGERWARHWMDIAHFAETHGHDEDAPRENAWPYREYLIESFNSDKPYTQFIEEQIAADQLAKHDPAAVRALGFLSSGPWDESSQMGIQDGTVDKKIAQYLDRDDMITTTMSTFVSMTVHCARCHDHRFDPVPTEDYYALQAVFSGVDRIDRTYDQELSTHNRRRQLLAQQETLSRKEIPVGFLEDQSLRSDVSRWAKNLHKTQNIWRTATPINIHSENGSEHSQLEDGSVYFSGPKPDKDTYEISWSENPGRVTGLRIELLSNPGLPKSGPGRAENGNLHLSGIKLHTSRRVGASTLEAVQLSNPIADFNQDGWSIDKALDDDPKTAWGIFPQVGQPHQAILKIDPPLETNPETVLKLQLSQLHGGSHLIGQLRISTTSAPIPHLVEIPSSDLITLLRKPPTEWKSEEWKQLTHAYLTEENSQHLKKFPDPLKVFAVSSDFKPRGNYKPAITPRPVSVLRRGSIHDPVKLATPGALTCLSDLQSRMPPQTLESESKRRGWLAKWISSPRNPLTWRSIVNRVWQYHFGDGITRTPNDFGVMGDQPSHPTLLDWLAIEFRDHGGSFKHLHKLIMLSEVYQQSSETIAEFERIDPENRLVWRMNLRRADAETLRDSILSVSGLLDRTMGGPSTKWFHQSKGIHVTPILDYLGFAPDNPANFRRSIYRFIFRTVPDPFMKALDCADPNLLVAKRTESVTPDQALALMNNGFVINQCDHIATRLSREWENLNDQINRLFELALGRPANNQELEDVATYAKKHGLANACRMILNSNEFAFVP